MDSDISRGFVMPPSSLATVSTPPQKGKKKSLPFPAAVDYTSSKFYVKIVWYNFFSWNFFPDTPEIVEVEDVKRDEVAIVVGSRKNSMTKAVR